ncbi:MAG TPA: ZIP family metal transporter [Pirellulaceae bacterium]|nr:ZIP family metal transporter [Pirellulaceae bacterium]
MYLLLVVYCIVIATASVFGGSLPQFVKFTHRRVQFVISFVSGVMLGVALLHLLPHSIVELGRVSNAMLTCLAGLLAMFFLIRLFNFHSHDTGSECEQPHEHSQSCQGLHAHVAEPVPKHGHAERPISWIGLCIGLGLHTLLDGLALAAAFQVESGHGRWAGLGTFLAIALHKPLDAFAITALMKARGWNAKQQTIVNLVFATVCPLGALLFIVSLNQIVDYQSIVLGLALAFSAGVFLCISLGDLLPEVHFHSHDRVWLSVMLLLGVAVAFGIEQLPGHSHDVLVK